MRALATLLLVAACATPRGGGPDPVVRGVVVSVDASALPRDGDAVVVVRTEAGERTVRIPAREARCPADLLDATALVVGERVEARGAVGADGSVTPCAETSHYLRRLGG